MRWVFPRGDDGRRHVHGGGKGLRVIVRGDGGQHAGEFCCAGQIVFHCHINIAFRGHGIASFSGVA
jgi:hypothetical protein